MNLSSFPVLALLDMPNPTPQGTVGYTYDAAGRRSSLTVPGQSVANYTFDNANRLTQIVQGSTTVSFSYDNANRRTTLTLPNGITASYSYDNASQLAGLTYAKGSSTLGNLTYSYDLNGRRTNIGGSLATTNLPNAVSTTAYNASNQLTSWGTANLFYDVNGNMTSDGTHSYAWDARNHLKQIDSGTTASFIYDPLGRRISKNILGTATSFLYDGANAVQEVIGGSNTANSLMGGIDEVFQRADSSGARSFLADALGSSIALADSTGTLQTQYTFDPFGNTTQGGSSTTNSFAYTGRELDSTGLYFYRARYYNPSLQRFISEDPIGFTGGIDKYAYAMNNPTNSTDRSGLWAGGDDIVFALAGAGLGLVGQGISDAFSGKLSSLDAYVGSAVGGVVAGETLLYTGNPVLAGGAGGLVSSLTLQSLDSNGSLTDFKPSETAEDTLIGVATGVIPDAGTGLKVPAGQFVKGLPGAAVGGAVDGIIKRARPGGTDGQATHGRKPPANACDLNLLGCAAPLPL